MAFNRNKLVLVSAQSAVSTPKVWLYTTTDAIADINTANYFLNASRHLSVNDMIIVWSSTGGTLAVHMVIVNSVTVDSAVDVTDGVNMLTGRKEGSKLLLQGVIPDVSTAATIFLMSPVAGTVASIKTKLGAAISGADAVLAFKVNAGTTMGGITVANSGSAVGDEDSLTPSANNTVAVGDYIRCDTDGASTGAAPLSVIVEITETGSVDSD